MRRRAKVRDTPYETRKRNVAKRDEELADLLASTSVKYHRNPELRGAVMMVGATLKRQHEHLHAKQQREDWEYWKSELPPVRLGQLEKIIEQGDTAAARKLHQAHEDARTMLLRTDVLMKSEALSKEDRERLSAFETRSNAIYEKYGY